MGENSVLQPKWIQRCSLLLIAILGCTVLLLQWPRLSIAQTAPLIEPYLASGQLAEGEAAMAAWLKTKPNDEKARFGLGVVQVIRGVERLTQSLYRYGLRDEAYKDFLPVLRLPVPPNKKPEPLTYAAARDVLQTWLNDLNQAQTTLAQVSDPTIKLPLRMGMIRLDINGDGRITQDESFWRVFAKVTRARVTEKEAQKFLIAFDTADAVWLRGYCNLLGAMVETVLAHDWQELLESTGHLFFTQVQSPHTFLREGRGAFDFGSGFDFSDAIALIHLMNFAVVEPTRMTSALQHLQTTLALSRQSWKLILAETDNDHEWVPKPQQKGVIPGVRVTKDMVDGWLSFLDESEALLNGQKLVPFWRGRPGRGVNLQRVFAEPRRTDLVLWVQGSAATPYLENGTLTDRRIWNELMQVFGGRFFGFAAWFN